MTIIGARKFSYGISLMLVALSYLALAMWGLKLGIDFTGGSILEVEWSGARPSNERVGEILDLVGMEHGALQPTGERGLILRLANIDEARNQELKAKLVLLGEFEEKRFNAIGPTIGAELRRKSLWAIVMVLVFIVIYIAWAFRQVSKPIQSWKYGIAAIIALVHDVSIPAGVFAVLGRFYNIEVDTLFVTALLTILGFSVHDTIVVFDRIRENLRVSAGLELSEIINNSINQTLVRSINTSLTVIFVLLALIFFGGETIRYFVLAAEENESK